MEIVTANKMIVTDNMFLKSLSTGKSLPRDFLVIEGLLKPIGDNEDVFQIFELRIRSIATAEMMIVPMMIS